MVNSSNSPWIGYHYNQIYLRQNNASKEEEIHMSLQPGPPGLQGDEPNWAKILDQMYTTWRAVASRASEDDDLEYDVYPPLGKNIDAEETQKALKYLETRELIEEFREYGEMRLTETGLRIAHERHLEKERSKREEQRAAYEKSRDQRQHDVNRAIALLTLGLVLVGTLQAAATATVGAGLNEVVSFIPAALGFVSLFILGTILWKAGLLSKLESDN